MVTTRSLLDALDLESIGLGRYRAGHADMGYGTVSGGQLLGQSLIAAGMGHTDKLPKTVHAIFARAASADAPIEILVEPVQSGRAFASSAITISQGDRVCVKSLVLLTADEPDLIRHADPAPLIAPPGPDVEGDGVSWQVHTVGGIDIADPEAVGPPSLDVWVRFQGAPDDVRLAQALVAFSTDFFLIGTAMRPHAGVGQAQAHSTLSTGVISHTLTFHEPTPAAEWTLLSNHSTYAGRGRSYGRADVFGANGDLAASFVQDAMIRPMASAGSGKL